MTNNRPLDLSYEEPMFKDDPKSPRQYIDFVLHPTITAAEAVDVKAAVDLGLLKYSPGLALVDWLNDYAKNTNDGRPRLSYSLVDGTIPTITVTKAI